MSDVDILSELLHQNILVKLGNNYRNYKVTLTEPQCPQSSVEIAGLPETAIVLKIDDFFNPSDVFQGSKGECKRADYAVIAEYNAKKRIVFIELKKNKDAMNGIIRQFKGAVAIVKYCQEIGKQFWNKTDFLEEFDFRFVSFGHTSIRKRKTRIKRDVSGSHNKPETMMKIDWPANIRFEHLAGA